MEEALQSIKKAAATARATGSKTGLKRDLKDTAEYDKSAVTNISGMLASLQTSKKSLSDMLNTLGSVSAHEISHDGMLGGRGYVMTIRDIRDDVTSAVNLVTNLVDTISDEPTNPKWGLSKEEIDSHKDGTSAPSVEGPTDDAGAAASAATADSDEVPSIQDETGDGSDLDKIMDMFGDSAPATHGDQDPATDVSSSPVDAAQEPSSAAQEPSATEPALEQPEPVGAKSTDVAQPGAAQEAVVEDPEAALNLPYKKLAALASSMEADKVACALRAPILYNILDGHAAAQ